MKMKQNFRNTRGTSSEKTDHTTSDGQLSNVFRLTLLVDGRGTYAWRKNYHTTSLLTPDEGPSLETSIFSCIVSGSERTFTFRVLEKCLTY